MGVNSCVVCVDDTGELHGILTDRNCPLLTILFDWFENEWLVKHLTQLSDRITITLCFNHKD